MALFYILDTRQVVGNEALWWGPDRSGYTTNLEKAGLYTGAEITGLRITDIPVPRDVALSLSHPSVNSDKLASAGYRRPKERYRPWRCAICPRFIRRDGWLCQRCVDAGLAP
jgi:hypothetical protein